jgi:hypothetical protein
MRCSAWVFWVCCGGRSGSRRGPRARGGGGSFEAFFTAGLRLLVHWFVVEVLQCFEVQIHQLTSNTMVAVAKFMWAATTYGGEPSVEVFAENASISRRRLLVERLCNLARARSPRGLGRL